MATKKKTKQKIKVSITVFYKQLVPNASNLFHLTIGVNEELIN